MNESSAVPVPECPYCGGIPHQHVGQCSAVKAIEYYEDGRIKRVEKFSSLPWPYGEGPLQITVGVDRLLGRKK